MKQLSIFILFSVSIIMCLSFFSCKKENEKIYINNAEITGEDNSLRPCWLNKPCDCPGGYFIHIDNVSHPVGNCMLCNFFKAVKLPQSFNLGDNPQYPIAVKINWQYDTMLCDSSHIDIISIIKR